MYPELVVFVLHDQQPLMQVAGRRVLGILKCQAAVFVVGEVFKVRARGRGRPWRTRCGRRGGRGRGGQAAHRRGVPGFLVLEVQAPVDQNVFFDPGFAGKARCLPPKGAKARRELRRSSAGWLCSLPGRRR